MSDKLPARTIPYFIAAPPYTSKSAGVVTLYRLCHYLNESGQKAYIMQSNMGSLTNPYLNAPILTPDVSSFFMAEGIEPIFIYPDIVKGNPFNAKKVCWFLLHYPGAYGGQVTFTGADHVWSFSPHIASFTPHPKNVLSVPNLDLDLFKLPPEGTERKGGCYYANKYLASGHKLLPLTDGMTKLEGTHQEIADILKISEICYVYENTSVISESVLCGCPVVLVSSDYFTDCHSLETQTGKAGVRWSHESKFQTPIEVALFNYENMCGDFFYEQVRRFIRETQMI